MVQSQCNRIPARQRDGKKRCMACGEPLSGRQKRWCADDCRRQLRAHLNRRTGLLVALNTRYATFYFTGYLIVLDVLPYGMDRIFSFMLPRRPGRKPVEDFREMSNLLGSLWWAERNKTHKRYKATGHLLERARKMDVPVESVMPVERVHAAVKGRDLVVLKLTPADLDTGRLDDIIKRAYRRQAKRHHPDLGGNPVTFRKLQSAYESLMDWSRNPRFTRRRGIADKWFYEGAANRWLQPTPVAHGRC